MIQFKREKNINAKAKWSKTFGTYFVGDMYCVLYSQGCFLNNIDCYDQPKCIEKREEPKKALMFCCCEGDMCNRNFTWEPVSTHPPPSRKFQCGDAPSARLFN